MLKKIAFTAAGIALLASPLITSADTLSDVQEKIAALLRQVAQLQDQLRSLKRADPIPFARPCPQILRTLDQGISGSDVKELQAYLGVSETGYFGPMTARAVAAFQAEEGLTQAGIVGPMTRAAFARRCGWGNRTFTASPTSGAAPLTVTFSARGGKDAPIDFGDGSTGTMTVTGPMMGCPNDQTDQNNSACGTYGLSATHIYATAGTYTAKLRKIVGVKELFGGGDPNIYEVVSTVTIRVGGTDTWPEFSVSPTSGVVPLTVTATFSLGSSCSPFTLTWGDGSNSNYAGPPAGMTCAAVVVSGVQKSHTYTAAGTYTVTYQTGGSTAKTATVTVGPRTACPGAGCPDLPPNTPGAPVVNGIDGPASLGAGATGLWTVRASVPNNTNTQLRYSVIWGDEGVLDQIRAFGNAAAGVLQTTGTFTHAYARAGTFRPTFTVSNTFGSVQTGMSVVVGGDGDGICEHAAPPAGCYWKSGNTCSLDTLVCDGDNSTFSASPTSGAAPLTVIFRSSIVNGLEAYSINFGDGASGTFQNNCAFGLGGCGMPTAMHTYTANGTYTATLMSDNCWTDACTNGYKSLGTVTITVGGSTSSGTFTATPKTGAPPLMVTFTGVGNNISFGDDGPILVASENVSLGTVTHVYRTGGEYTATSDKRSVNISVIPDRLGALGQSASSKLCVYNNRTYQSGTSVDVPVRSCGSFDMYRKCAGAALGQAGTGAITSQRYSCQNGQWVDQYGGWVDGELVNATSCLASDGMSAVANGQMIAQGFGALGFDLSLYPKRLPTMKCDNGKWLSCDSSGNNCTQASAGTNTNLASALTALESAIKAFIANLGQ
ncbi:peptidoglycan-binding protein [Candidatus Kaiserbacteria bacterium]|nr:peptidoglycan-binding protein [Candidatus Kaiserbacteria bacterium]